MESGLLNAFHDDQYDDNFSKYETETNYWSDGNETFGLQLTETLHGILPISPTEDKSSFFENDIEMKYSFHLQDDIKQESSICVTKKQDVGYSHKLSCDTRQNLSSPTFEIISVDPNCDFSSPISMQDESDGECSMKNSSSFRSRTESSSIGDYESHTSDESDFEDYTTNLDNCSRQRNYTQEEKKVSEKVSDIQADLHFNKQQVNEVFDNKKTKDIISTGPNPLEVDFACVRDFDLAAFITEDDYSFDPNQGNIQRLPSTNVKHEAESDTEIIVDIETVQENENEEIVDFHSGIENQELLNCSFSQIEDDPIKDPSWSPTTKNVKSQKLPRAKTRNLVKNSTIKDRIGSNNKQNCISKSVNSSDKSQHLGKLKSNAISGVNRDAAKFGLGRGKNISMCAKPDTSSSESEDETVKDQTIKKSTPVKAEEKNTGAIHQNIEKKPNTQSVKPVTKHVQHFTAENNKRSISQVEIIVAPPHAENSIKTLSNSPQELDKESIVMPVKKKLNLEEYYKKRRESKAAPASNSSKICEVNAQNLPQIKKLNGAEVIPVVEKSPQLPQVNGNTFVSKREIYQAKIDKKYTDPIMEAKNKVLRLQELKRAQQCKIIDSTVSAKVGPVTKILPLEEIVKTSRGSKKQTKQVQKLNPDYEEIVIVSASCNTDITLPPSFRDLDDEMVKENPSSKLLKSSTLLYKINNTLQKAKSTDNIRISSCSLISSIQDVVLKKSTTVSAPTDNFISQNSPHICGSPPIQLSPGKPEMSQTDAHNKKSEHGEDKIIMHLRKDRIKPKLYSNSTQTEILPQFPPLKLFLKEVVKPTEIPHCNSKEKRMRRNYRSRGTSVSSNEEEYRSRSRSRYRSSSQTSRRSSSSKQSRYHSRRGSYKNRSNSKSTDYKKNRRGRSRERSRRKYSSSSRSESSYSSDNRSSSSRYTVSRSRSRSGSRPRSHYSSNRCRSSRRYERNVSPAVEERRIVYVGRIESETSKEDLKRKFMTYGPIRQITLHYKDTGMKYGFVTFEKAQDAFKAIDSGPRDPKVNMYDISFGGRRAFCQASYSDLDGAATNSLQVFSYSSAPRPSNKEESFEDLLQKVKEKLCSAKSSNVRVKT